MSVITVRRQVLDVSVRGAESDGLQLQARLPALCADAVAPALESALEPFDADDAHLIIDLLDVDLGEIGLEQLELELAAALRREVEIYLRSHEPTAGDEEGTARDAGFVRRTTEETVDGALIWFLRAGRLPWSFRLPPGMPFEQVILAAWSDTGGHPPPATLAALAAELKHPDARARLVRQFSPQFAVDLLRALSPGVALASGEVMAVLEPEPRSEPMRRFLPEPVRRRFARRVWDAALRAAVTRENPSAGTLAQTAWRASEPFERTEVALAAILEGHWPGSTDASLATGAAVSRSPESSEEAGRAAAVASLDSRREPTGEPPEEASDGILVEHAGLVLLHPFLPRFLDALGLTVEDELVEPERALCLLDHLATGELVAPEHRLTVAKVLCDVPLDRPVSADVGITAAEIEEAGALLEAVIAHWDALGHASPAALRGEFLEREGVLTLDPAGDWLLRVESRTIDILLDRLPWGVSIIQLPWMRRLLKVEWR